MVIDSKAMPPGYVKSEWGEEEKGDLMNESGKASMAAGYLESEQRDEEDLEARNEATANNNARLLAPLVEDWEDLRQGR